ncbi:MAG: hypothetical protein NWE83_09220 [Candidatus Bathyarchaeota archaeon]|nr:hypothetical protein [Candidatus Bathyarchaeota archaeon]
MSKFDSFNYWLEALLNNHKAPSTIRGYRQRFEKFCAYMDKTPDELFDMQNDALKARRSPDVDPREGYIMERHVNAYLQQLRKERGANKGDPVGHAERQHNLYAIKSFFALNQVPLTLKNTTQRDSGDTGSAIPSQAFLSDLITNLRNRKNGNPRLRYKALLLTLKDSGLRVSDVEKLRYSKLASYTHTHEARSGGYYP